MKRTKRGIKIQEKPITLIFEGKKIKKPPLKIKEIPRIKSATDLLDLNLYIFLVGKMKRKHTDRMLKRLQRNNSDRARKNKENSSKQ